MEMAFRPQSPLCPRSRPALVVRPAGSGGGGGLAQPFLTTGRFTRSRIVQCMVASSDSPNRKPRTMVSPQIKVASSRGYAPRLTVESSTKKREQSNSDEETLGTYNRLLSTDAKEWTTSREVETAEVDLSQNASSRSIMREVDAADEDIFQVDLKGNALNSVTLGEVDAVDETGDGEDIFEVELSGTVMREVVRVDEAGAEEVEVDLSRLSLSSPTIGGVDAVDEAGAVQDTFEADLLGNISSGATMGEVDAVDEAGAVKDTFVVDLSGNVSSSETMGEVDAVDEARALQDIFEADLLGNVSSSATYREVDVVEAGIVQETFEADLSGNVSISEIMGEVDAVDEARADQDTSEADLSGNILSSATYGKVDVVDETRAVQDKFEVHLSGNVSSSATYGEVDVVYETMVEEVTFEMDLSGNASSSARLWEMDEEDETMVEEVTFEMNLSGNASSSARLWEMDEEDEARAKEETFEMDLLGGVSGNAKHMAVDFVGEVIAEEETYQQQYPVVSSTSMAGKAIDRTPVCSKPELMPLVRAQEQGKSPSSVHEQEGIATFHEQDQPMVVYLEQGQPIIAFDKQNQPIARFPKQDQSISAFPEQNQSIIASHEQDRSTVDFPEQNKSIIGPHKSIVAIPQQIQSIVGSSKQEQSIVAFRKQDQSIVSVPEQKQSIAGFHKQDLSIVGLHKQNLSIVGTSGEGQTKQVAVVGRHDAFHVKGVEAKDGDYTSQKTDGDALRVKFDVDNLLQKHKAYRTEEAVEMTTSKKVNREHLSMTEDQIGAVEEQMMVTEDRLSMTEDGRGIGDNIQHVLFEEELAWAEDEVGFIEDDEQYEVDETSTSVEPDIQVSPQDDVDPQTLRRMLQELADKNYSMGNKLFVFPEVVKADSVIDLYLNRDLTALASEPDVVIKGAFNGWRWRLFTERLHKSELGGDWWSCKLYIPKEAYRLDFVFFNGRSVYENNGNNDFVIEIESPMDEDLFDDFLVKEKQRELERLAIEEAERRTQTEEQRRREEERAVDEAVRAQVKAEVQLKKNKLHNMLSLARTCADNLWHIETSTHGQGDTVRLYYNRNSRLLVNSTEIWMHGGYNNWTDGLSIVERLVKCDEKDGDWWYADVILPEKALVLDWVFADGPPGNARNYDNNGRQDFHAILPNIMTEEDYWVEEEQGIYTRLLQERREREEAIKRKAERSAKMKAEMKAKTMRRFLLSQKHIVYTEPLEIRAGTTVDVLYNPSNTVLNGKPEVWFRCSFNLWMHPGGGLPPQKMVKARDGSLLKATVSVPPDAYMMDFVFSESEDGGIYDNRNGMDYHIPISASVATETRMHIVHIAVEMAPIAKVGGLGDVVTSLSRAVQDLGHTVEVILPKYDCLNQSSVKNLHLYRSFSWGGTEIKVWLGLVEDLSVYFLEPQNGMFGVGCVYGRNDDRRFGFFCHSALEFILQNGSSPHIIHCHDWSSAPVAWLYKEHYAQSILASARVVFTIHNLEFGAHYIGKAMTFCDKATTVSHTYSREVASHGAIAPHSGKFYGILNGIDPDIWDPYTDNFIPVPYTSENVVEGKNAAKRALQQKLGLQQTDVPIVGIVTRLTAQKGIHLIKHAIHRTLESNGQVVLLGSAPDPRIQGDFCRLADSLHGVYHGRVKFVLTYDEPLSHLIYAGSDFILVPSIFEPCGLTQLVAMRYGSIPIVRRTGGLYDTVFDVDHDKDRARSLGLEPNGFSFDGADSNGVDYALNRAIAAWFDARDWFHSLCKRVMEQDWSWNRPALDYIELYHSARKF